MRTRQAFFGIGLVMILALSASEAFPQTAQNRIPQQVSINGQMVNGAYVTTAGGQIQSFTCPAPQHYTTADGSSQGWACYEQTTGVWLLNAVPPAQAPVNPAPVPVPQQPPLIYQQAPPPAVVYQQAPPAVVYQQVPPVVYQPAPVTVVYQQPPMVIYQEPPRTVVYTSPPPVVVAPAYPSSVVLGRAAINAAGRIASAAIISAHHSRPYYHEREHDRGRRW